MLNHFDYDSFFMHLINVSILLPLDKEFGRLGSITVKGQHHSSNSVPSSFQLKIKELNGGAEYPVHVVGDP